MRGGWIPLDEKKQYDGDEVSVSQQQQQQHFLVLTHVIKLTIQKLGL